MTAATYREDKLLAPPHPDARDTVGVVLAEHTHGGEGVLPELVNALEHAWRVKGGKT